MNLSLKKGLKFDNLRGDLDVYNKLLLQKFNASFARVNYEFLASVYWIVDLTSYLCTWGVTNKRKKQSLI
jgi:hypothetical protein